MADIQHIREAFERNRKAVETRPYVGLRTATTHVRIVDGYTCEIEEGRWKLTADLHPKVGGNGKGPDSGVFGRAAFGSCIAMGYVQWGAAFGISFSKLEVIVEADSDNGGYYDTNDSPPGYIQVRFRVMVESEAPREKVLEVLDKADKHSPYHDVFSRALDIRRTVEINGTEI